MLRSIFKATMYSLWLCASLRDLGESVNSHSGILLHPQDNRTRQTTTQGVFESIFVEKRETDN